MVLLCHTNHVITRASEGFRKRKGRMKYFVAGEKRQIGNTIIQRLTVKQPSNEKP
jgi:hypothetical protein